MSAFIYSPFLLLSQTHRHHFGKVLQLIFSHLEPPAQTSILGPLVSLLCSNTYCTSSAQRKIIVRVAANLCSASLSNCYPCPESSSYHFPNSHFRRFSISHHTLFVLLQEKTWFLSSKIQLTNNTVFVLS